MMHEILHEASSGKKRNASCVGTAALFVVMLIRQSMAPNAAICAESQEFSGSAPSSIADITAEWWDRESRFDTVHLRWHTFHDSAGSGNNNYQVEFPPARDRNNPVAESFWLSGHQICHESKRWYAELNGEFAGYDREDLFGKFVESLRQGQQDIRRWDRAPYQFKLVWNQAIHRELLDGVDGTPPLGTIRNSSNSLLRNSMERISAGIMFWPALMAFRPTIALGVTPSNHGLIVENETSMIGDLRCTVVDGQCGPTDNFRLWVSADKSFSVVRAMIYSDGNIREQIDTEYSYDAGLWFPSAWNIMVFNSAGEYPGQAEVFRSVRIEVDSHELNVPIESAHFHLVFPDKTIVNDATSNKVYVIVEGAAGRPPTSPESRLLKGMAEPAPIDSRHQSAGYYTKVGSALALAIVAFWAVRRRKKTVSSIANSDGGPNDLGDRL